MLVTHWRERTVPEPVLTAGGRRVLAAASDLFYRRGIHAVGVDTIAAAAGVTKKTLYDRFGSKDQLVAAYLRARDQRWRAWLTEATEAAQAAGPREQLLASFDALAQWLGRESPRGCSFINALAELPDPDHPGRAVIADQKRWLREHLRSLASTAGQPQLLAEQLLLLHEGAMVSYATGAVEDPVAHAKQVAALLIDRSLP
jgi:AcrR family transcriptional regulator